VHLSGRDFEANILILPRVTQRDFVGIAIAPLKKTISLYIHVVHFLLTLDQLWADLLHSVGFDLNFSRSKRVFHHDCKPCVKLFFPHKFFVEILLGSLQYI
jgi:hypothetical protein